MRTYEEFRHEVDHLIAEHRRLHRLLRLAGQAISGTRAFDQDACRTDVVRTLRRLRDDLARHFTEEESSEGVAEAFARCQELSAECRRLEGEHPRLLASVDRLIAQVLDCDQSLERRIELEVGFDDLQRQLDAHEGAENALLCEAVAANMNRTGPT